MGEVQPVGSTVPRRARFFFDVMNLPLDRELVCDGFKLAPLEDPDKLFETLKSTDAQDVTTARGFYDVADPVPESPEGLTGFPRKADQDFALKGRHPDDPSVLCVATQRSVSGPSVLHRNKGRR